MRKPMCVENSFTVTTVKENKLIDLFSSEEREKQLEDLNFYEWVVRPEIVSENKRYIYSFRLNVPRDTKDVGDRVEALKQNMFPAFTFSSRFKEAIEDLIAGDETVISYERLILMTEWGLKFSRDLGVNPKVVKVDEMTMIDVSLIREDLHLMLFKLMRVEHVEDVYEQLTKLRTDTILKREFLTEIFEIVRYQDFFRVGGSVGELLTDIKDFDFGKPSVRKSFMFYVATGKLPVEEVRYLRREFNRIVEHAQKIYLEAPELKPWLVEFIEGSLSLLKNVDYNVKTLEFMRDRGELDERFYSVLLDVNLLNWWAVENSSLVDFVGE